MIETMTSIYRS